MRWCKQWICAAAIGMLAACGGGGGDADPAAPPDPPTSAATAQVEATVVDALGRYVAGAALVSSAGNAMTDAAGRATLPVAVGSEAVVNVTKDGFAEQIKVLNLPTGTTQATLMAMLIERDAAQILSAIEAGASASGRDGVKVTFPPGALVTPSGAAVSGSIEVWMTPVDVANPLLIAAFPGLFEGSSATRARSALVSYGTAELVPMQNGQKLQLAAGKTAEIELPIYVTTHQDGSAIAVGDKVPLWSLVTANGLWREEGEGTVVASAGSPTGLALRATISHFSWWNGDGWSSRATASLTVTASGETVPADALADVTGTVIDGPTSQATQSVAIGVRTGLRVPAGSTTRLVARAQFGNRSCQGEQTVNPAPDSEVDVVVDMNCVVLPTPRLVRPSTTVYTNSSSALSYQVIVDGPQPDAVELRVDDDVIATFPRQFFYAGGWDTSGRAEGSYTLRPVATLEGQTSTGAGVTVVVDRSGPQLDAYEPAADVAVSRDTTLRVTFDESVSPLPFGLQDAVALSVLPLGGTTPVAVPFTASLDNASQTLVVQPAAPLPIGTLSLNWGGLRDLAGNPPRGTVGLQWSVSRTTALAADMETFFGAALPLAIGPDGVPHIVRKQAQDGLLQALRFDGTAFVPLGPTISEREVENGFAAVMDSSGRLIVAYSQVQATGTDREVVVKRYDAQAGQWQPLGAPFAAGHGETTAPALAIGTDDRPVLVFRGGGTDQFNRQVMPFRHDGSNWVPLGAFSSGVYQWGEAPALQVAVGSNGRVHVLMEAIVFFSAVLQVYEGGNGSWTFLGQLDSAPNASLGDRKIAVGPDDRPWVAWKGTGAEVVKLVRHDGTAFVQVPITPELPSLAGGVGLAFLDGDPVLAAFPQYFGGGVVNVVRLRNGQWEPAVTAAVPETARRIELRTFGSNVFMASAHYAGSVFSGRVTRIAFP